MIILTVIYSVMLVSASVLSVGLSVHMMRFNSLNRNLLKIGALLLLFITISTLAVLSVTKFEPEQFKVNKETDWARVDQPKFSYLDNSPMQLKADNS